MTFTARSRLAHWVIGALLIAVGLSPSEAKKSAQPEPVAIGYVPVFRGAQGAATAADYHHYTHLMLAFVNPDPEGRFVAGDALACAPNGPGLMLSSAEVRKTVSAAHAAGSKVLASLGGGLIPPCSGDWALLLKPDKRSQIVAGLIAMVESHGLDGIDVDIEGELLTRIDKAGNFMPFITELSAALKARGKLLTCATASYEGGMVPVASVPYFDLVAIMSYDAIGTSWGQAGSEHSSYEQAERDMRLWLERGVKPERLILGVPFYGYGFGGSYKPNYSFREIRSEFGKSATKQDVVGKRCAGCAYITFNGLETLKKKAGLARRLGGGLMVWEITHDTSDRLLIRTLKKAWRRGER